MICCRGFRFFRPIFFRQRKLDSTLPTFSPRSQELSTRCLNRPLTSKKTLNRPLILSEKPLNRPLILSEKSLNRPLTTSEGTEWRKHVGEEQRKKRFDLESEEQSIDEFHTDDSRVFEDLTVEKYEEIIKSSRDRELVEEILNDYEYAKYTSFRVPVTISAGKMRRLMEETSNYNTRIRFFNYLFTIEFRKEADKRRREREGMMHQMKIKSQEEYPIGTLFNEKNQPIYRKWHNALFMRVSDRDMQAPMDWNKAQSAIFGRKIVFDVGFEHEMKMREIINLSDQITDCYALNQIKANPFDLHFCNFPVQKTNFVQALEKRMPNLWFPNTLISIHTESYLEIFPKKKLIYLSPNASQELKDWEEDEVLIIGGIVDLVQSKPLTKAKAKREGIRSAKLPLDQHVAWGSNKKALPLNQIVGMLADFQSCKNWRQAIVSNVASRKLKSTAEIEEEERLRAEKMKFKRKKFFKVDSFFDSSDQRPLDDTYQDMEDGCEKSGLERRNDRNFRKGNNDRNRNSKEKGGRSEDAQNFVKSYDFIGKFGR